MARDDGREIFHAKLGKFFRELREKRGLGQRQVANIIRTSPKAQKAEISAAVGWLEQGRTKNPDPDLVKFLADLYRADRADVVAEVVKHLYGISLVRGDVDAGEIARLTAELATERELRVRIQQQLDAIRDTLNPPESPPSEQPPARGARAGSS